jgi:coniferyl-aldehyde dehydrogenase
VALYRWKLPATVRRKNQGEEGFRALSHGKAVFKRQRWFPTQLFYPPYGRWVQRLVMKFYLG